VVVYVEVVVESRVVHERKFAQPKSYD
ncbi:hypothetical protein A2U01_0116651, partial [Trifolium medium]|nr:hypothetical protein [Trifolium medium]